MKEPLFQFVLMILAAAPGFTAESASVTNKHIRIDFDGNMYSRVVASLGSQERAVGEFSPSEFIPVSGHGVTDFSLQDQKRETVHDRLGTGSRTIITGTAPSLKKTVTVTVYDEF